MIKITDHALVRYLERVLGWDLEGVRQVIVRTLDSQGARRLVEFGGGAKCKITTNGIVFCLRGHTVTTCLGAHRERRVQRRPVALRRPPRNRRPQRRRRAPLRDKATVPRKEHLGP